MKFLMFTVGHRWSSGLLWGIEQSLLWSIRWALLWVLGWGLLSLKVIVEVQEWILWKAHVRLTIGHQQRP